MQIATLQFARKRYRGSSVNDVTLEGGGGVQTLVAACDVGGGGLSLV